MYINWIKQFKYGHYKVVINLLDEPLVPSITPSLFALDARSLIIASLDIVVNMTM